MSLPKRQPAIKTRIQHILNGTFVKENEDIPNHVLLKDGTRISRVNIIATITQADTSAGYPIITLDDGTGNIMARAFEQTPALIQEPGTIAFVIGRIREFGQERYIIPETIKKIKDMNWTLVRTKELECVPEQNVQQTTQEKPDRNKIIRIIKSLDSGEGADEEQVIAESGMQSAEKELQQLTQQGLLFSPKPGRIKVLD